MRSLIWVFLSIVILWAVLVLFVNFSESKFSIFVEDNIGILVPVFIRPGFALESEIFIDQSASPNTQKVQINSDPKGGYRIIPKSGELTWQLGPEGYYAVLFAHRMTHTWVGRVKYGSYIFDSDPDQPLVFRVDKDRGYRYIRGKGTVTMPDGKIVNLPK